ncbi:fimbrillin family protein [Alistipes sp. An66]|uniref:fimbrillin family protein n=1 Tax=Alistipes sp. An66 TaxID=1965650 RepID=UPI000B396971|nr:fimbrillin family protein [Alistipes sp. An66]OUN58056.1 hypothetical protein B5G16_10435 [Alistipes sp. An66]
MKKTLLMMAVAAGAMLTGCVKNETANGGAVSGSKISFEAPAVTGITRAALVPGEIGTGYDKGEHFSVYALYFANGTYTEFGDGTLYMDNVETAYNTGGQYWDSESVPGGQAYYWPKKGSLTFAAYSPTGAANDCKVAWGAAGFTFTGFTVQSEPANHYDLLFSERAYNKTQSETSSTTYKGGVDITFKHALSSVVFKTKLGDTYTGHTITLKNITLKNTFTKGNFNQGLVDENNAVTTAAAWSGQNTENTAGYVAFNGAEVITSTAAEPAGAKRLIVLPQDLAHGTNNVTIDVTYSIDNGTNEIDQTATIDITDPGYNLTEFEIGKRYIFTLIIGLDKITFSPDVDEWEDVPGIDIEL